MPKLSNKQYDILKLFTLIVLPLSVSGYIAITELLNFGINQGVETWSIICMAILGIVLIFSSHWYNKSDDKYDGYVELDEDPGGLKRANLIMNGDPETLLTTKKSIHFKIRREPEE